MRANAVWRTVVRAALFVLFAAILGTTPIVHDVGHQRGASAPSRSAVASPEPLPSTAPQLSSLDPDAALVLNLPAVYESAWRSVATWAGGRGTAQTSRFAIKGSRWRVVWQASGGSTRTDCALAIYVYDGFGGFVCLVANQPGVGAGQYLVDAEPGEFYLSVVSCRADWDIAVEDYY